MQRLVMSPSEPYCLPIPEFSFQATVEPVYEEPIPEATCQDFYIYSRYL